jgi:hypothetical protein
VRTEDVGNIHVHFRVLQQRVQHTSAYGQHTPAYASIRQHTPAYASIRQHTSAYTTSVCADLQEGVYDLYQAPLSSPHQERASAYVSIRQHTSAYVSMRQQTCKRECRTSIQPHSAALIRSVQPIESRYDSPAPHAAKSATVRPCPCCAAFSSARPPSQS